MSIKSNIIAIRKEIPANVKLVAATKTRTLDEINQAIEAGIETIGENYVQEAEEKFGILQGKVKIHCIGHLQTNKVRKAVEIFDLIETVDSLKLAKEIEKRCNGIKKIMPILIEINSGKEQEKDGVMPEQAIELIRNISLLKSIRVKGLMTMTPYFDDAEKSRLYFKLTKEIFDNIKSLNIRNVDMEILSMGMSDSYKVAIEEGANMVRIGTKIFGQRK